MKTKHLLLGLGAVALLLLGYGFVRNNTTPASAEASTGVLAAEEAFYDFGTITMKDGNVSHEYTVTNNGSEPVTIEKVYTSCMCTTAFITDAAGKKSRPFGMPGHGGASPFTATVVGPGEAITVEAVYDPNAHGPSGVGLADRLVYLETNSSVEPKVELRFKAIVTN